MATRKRRRGSKAGQKESNVQAFSVREFLTEFPSDDACLTRVMEVRTGCATFAASAVMSPRFTS